MVWRKNVKIVEVVWEDSMGMGGWRTHEVQDFIDKPESEHRSVGYLEASNRRGVWLAQSEGIGGARGDLLYIPRSAVRRVTTVMKATEK